MANSMSQCAPLPWQVDHWQRLLNQYQQNHLPHALLLSGHAGTGKRLFAQALAESLLCSQPVDGKACGQCKGCHLLSAGTHPDFIEISTEEKSRVIKVDQIRALKTFCGKTAQLNGYKVIILQPADCLNISSANALLKDLEEPQPNTVFILVSDQPAQIVATIRSRCHQLDFGVPSVGQATQWLAEQGVSNDALAQLLVMADNAPLLALQLHEEQALEKRKTIYRGLAEVQQGKSHPAGVAQSLQEYEPLDVVQWLQVWVADVIKAAQVADEKQLKNQDLAGFLMKTAEQAQLNRLYLYLDSLQQHRQALLSGHNPNKILLLESLLISWAQCFEHH